MVSRAMQATGDNQTRAAELLGITRDQLRYRRGLIAGGLKGKLNQLDPGQLLLQSPEHP